jgi:hypothetical protein
MEPRHDVSVEDREGFVGHDVLDDQTKKPTHTHQEECPQREVESEIPF